MVGFGRREFEFGDETIELVNDEDRTKFVEPGLTKDGNGLTTARRRREGEEEVSSRFWRGAEGNRMELAHLSADSLNRIDEHKSSVT